MFKVAIAIIAAVVTAGAFASTADARSGGSFYASPFFRNQGRQPAVDPMFESRKRAGEEAYARARARKLEAARQSAERQAAAARRARIAEQQRREAAQEAAKEAANKNATSIPRTAAATATDQPVAKREDRLPVVASEPRTTTAAAATTTASTAKSTAVVDTEKQPVARVCRKYSAAADGLVDTPCN